MITRMPVDRFLWPIRGVYDSDPVLRRLQQTGALNLISIYAEEGRIDEFMLEYRWLMTRFGKEFDYDITGIRNVLNPYLRRCDKRRNNSVPGPNTIP